MKSSLLSRCWKPEGTKWFLASLSIVFPKVANRRIVDFFSYDFFSIYPKRRVLFGIRKGTRRLRTTSHIRRDRFDLRAIFFFSLNDGPDNVNDRG